MPERTKPRKRATAAAAAPAPAPKPRRTWLYAAGLLAAFIAALQVYGPVLNGPFLFDDDYLPFALDHYPSALISWISGVRPLLMFTYWLNFRASGQDTYSYHLVNILFHAGASFLLFWIVRKLLSLAAVEGLRRDVLAAAAAAVFLLHPIQTEAVAYVASRSENQSVLLFFAAFAAFLYRRHTAISWGESAAVLALSAAAVATKEHALVLPALLLLTDYYWNPGFSFLGIRRNWRLYVPMAAGGLAGLAFIRPLLLHAASAGFSVKEFTWYQYFFTECRAMFLYLRLFLFPAGQSVDHDFAISHNIFEHGAIFALAALVLLGAAAIYFRKRYPLASYGFLAFLILMAPTSSFMPILDPVAERRLYLSMLGLLLIALEFARRLRVQPKALAAAACLVALIAGILTYDRVQVWTDREALWRDAVEKAPGKYRPRFQLAFALYAKGDCAGALREYPEAAKLRRPTYDLLLDWALAYDCLNQPEEAIAKLRQAAALEPKAHVYSQIGMIYAKQGKWAPALDALATAEKLDSTFATLYVYRGGIHLSTNAPAAAVEDYRRALRFDPSNEQARNGLILAEQRLRSAR